MGTERVHTTSLSELNAAKVAKWPACQASWAMDTTDYKSVLPS
jgi:hypothetical protein